MLNHTQELEGNCHVPSSKPTYHAQSRRGSGGDREFSFWCSSSNTESPTKDCVRLLGRPESAFELSFQYMVQQQQQQQQALQPVQTEAYIDEKMKSNVNEAQVKRKDTKEMEKNNNKPNQILRVESMDNENFLLKMFFPSTLNSKKKKAKVGNVPKLSPTPSFNNYVRPIGKEQMKRYSQTGDNRRDLKDHTDDSTNNSFKRRGKSRYADGNRSQGCWLSCFLSKTKKKEGSG